MKWAKTVSGTKVNNHIKSRADKVEIRRRVLEAVPHPAVVDAFAGAGRMHRDVWHRAERYIGIDMKWYPDARAAYVCDNLRGLRCIDLRPFNIFDLDAYGSPWEQALIVAERRKVTPGEIVGVILTDGSGLNMKMGGVPIALRTVAGFAAKVSGGARLQDEILDRAVCGLAARMRCEVVRRWEANGKTGAGVRYIGLVLRGQPDQEAA